jgi:hypothetical protein
MLARMRRACSRYSSPSGVRLMRRVVRLTSATPRRTSICARCLLTAAVLTPSSRPAALRLPARTSAEKKPRSAGWIGWIALRVAMVIGMASASNLALSALRVRAAA